jgi:hypothetical protein
MEPTACFAVLLGECGFSERITSSLRVRDGKDADCNAESEYSDLP